QSIQQLACDLLRPSSSFLSGKSSLEVNMLITKPLLALAIGAILSTSTVLVPDTISGFSSAYAREGSSGHGDGGGAGHSGGSGSGHGDGHAGEGHSGSSASGRDGSHAEPGDDHGIHAAGELGDDHGVHAVGELGDDRGVHVGGEPGDDKSGT